jgi:CheY-like chemotaxis protein
LHSVLLVDDEPALLEVLKPFVERSGEMTVQTTQSATEALKILPEKSFDVIIVDYDMPVINGIEFLKILRSQGDTTPVIIFTGVGHERTAIDAINYGANFFLQKDDDPKKQFHSLCEMIKTAVESRYLGKKLGTTGKIVSDMINFSLDPGFAIDNEGRVAAWNTAMEHLTGIPAGEMMGKGDCLYSLPFFGTKRKMLVNLVFEPDEEITRQKYRIISRVPKGPVMALTKGKTKDGKEWTLWSKAMPVYDMQGNFIAAAGIIRDVTATAEDVLIQDDTKDTVDQKTDAESRQPSKPGALLNKILAKSSSRAPSSLREGIDLSTKKKKYPEAVAAFTRALEINDKLPYAWNHLGLCYRQMGDINKELESLKRAVELAPDNPEILFNLGESLERVGKLHMSHKYLESAIQVFNLVAKLMPNNADAWNHIGVCYTEMGRSLEAKSNFDRARHIAKFNKHTPIVPKRDF